MTTSGPPTFPIRNMDLDLEHRFCVHGKCPGGAALRALPDKSPIACRGSAAGRTQIAHKLMLKAAATIWL